MNPHTTIAIAIPVKNRLPATPPPALPHLEGNNALSIGPRLE